MKKVLILFCAFVCVALSANAQEFMSRALNSWLGYPIDNVINYWGYPTEQKQMTGRDFVYWINGRNYYSTNQYGIYPQSIYCNKIFEINDDRIIVSWQYEGNSCPIFYFTGKKYVNPKNDKWKMKKEAKKLKRTQKKKYKEQL